MEGEEDMKIKMGGGVPDFEVSNGPHTNHGKLVTEVPPFFILFSSFTVRGVYFSFCCRAAMRGVMVCTHTHKRTLHKRKRRENRRAAQNLMRTTWICCFSFSVALILRLCVCVGSLQAPLKRLHLFRSSIFLSHL